ncbi:prevent-host-death protein [Candidatus Nomurabacteria bacterium]|jgi:antitoxin (DNA-binding transcriptional repressor) of toxin-antitoxin stability system|nr:prevent-host-death protein [Candidatus Nomurabacteria bacterium]
MSKVYAIHEAKTQLSKLVKKAEEGQVVYLGAYGKPTAILIKLPETPEVIFGVLSHKKMLNAYKNEDLIGPDPDIAQDFETSINRPLI